MHFQVFAFGEWDSVCERGGGVVTVTFHFELGSTIWLLKFCADINLIKNENEI